MPAKIFFFIFLFLMPAVFAEAAENRPLFAQTPELAFNGTLKGVKKISGAAWLPEESHYLLVSSKPAALHEIAVLKNGPYQVRTVKLKDFKDVSAVAYVGRSETVEEGNRIAIAEESKAEVSFCDLLPDQTELKRDKCKSYRVGRLMFWEKKFGIQGLAVNRDGDVPVFYFGKEWLPKEIYRGFFEDGEWNVRTIWDAEAMLPSESSIADLFYDQSLYVLDGTGSRVLQMDPLTGQTISEFHVKTDGDFRLSGFCLSREESGVRAVLTSNENRYFVYNIPATDDSHAG